MRLPILLASTVGLALAAAQFAANGVGWPAWLMLGAAFLLGQRIAFIIERGPIRNGQTGEGRDGQKAD